MNQIKIDSFGTVRKAMKKLYPNWHLFLDELMDRLDPFWLGTQSREEVHFIHLMGFGNRQKAREILTDFLELLDWQSDSIFLWENWDNKAPSPLAQAQAFQNVHPVFPRVVITDFFHGFFTKVYYQNDRCKEWAKVEEFLKERKRLDFSNPEIIPSDARGSLVISFLDSFADCDFVRTRFIFNYLCDQSVMCFEELRKHFVARDLKRMIGKGYFTREELIFFSKDDPYFIQLAFDLQKVCKEMNSKGSELLGLPVKLTFNAMDYFLAYVFYKKLSYPQLERVAWDFFKPVFHQFPRMNRKVKLISEKVELDFDGGWKFKATID